MKHLNLLGAAAALIMTSAPLWAQDDPFADTVEIRHGMMLQMAAELGKIGAMAKGETPYDAAVAGKAGANVAALASVISWDMFPEGSEVGKSGDSFAKAEIWANKDDFLAKLGDLNTAAGVLATDAGKDLDSAKTAMMGVGKACSACHETYRQPEN